MVPFRLCVVVLIGASVVLACGCGDGKLDTYAVTGTVTYQGKPVEQASVMFIPAKGRPASGRTDAQGRFTLRTYYEGDGAVAGTSTVCVSKKVSDPNHKATDPMFQKMISVLPGRYANPVTSPLKNVDVVAGGQNDFCFELTD